MNTKSKKYHHSESVHNTNAAEVIVPLVLDLLHPRSILDVGCGIGTWMNTFSKFGVGEVMGIDGDYVDKDLLAKYISLEDFDAVNLEAPFDLNRRFDLVISLEVAEHLKESSAEVFIDSICKHADIVLFSAAIPGQGGQNHLNEQWLSYWLQKFSKRGYKVYDPFRQIIWKDNTVETWYRQNMVLFSKENLTFPQPHILDVVLPDMWQLKVRRISRLENQLSKIKEGKVGFRFYLKGLIKSLRYFGRKQ
jgi:SAM-dependent methyltransferase